MSTVHDMVSESVNRMFSQSVDRQVLMQSESGAWPDALWRLVEASGFTHVLAEGAADVGEGWRNAYPVFHAVGFHRVPLPLAETVIANGLLAGAELAPRDGPLTLIQQDGGLALRLDGGRLVVQGAATAVPWARHARHLVIAGSAGHQRLVGIVAADAPGIEMSHAQNIAHEPRDSINFRDVRCIEHAPWDARLPDAPATLFGALARCAMIVGAAQSLLQQSVEYANQRVQFGRPIGKYQAIQHALAVLAGEVACAQTATLAACQAAAPAPSVFDVAVAKVRAGQAAGVSAGIAHQVHGAFGFTHEHTVHYATRRLWSWRSEFGGESVWAARLGRQAIERGGDAFWATLVDR
jgi:acyl-CoA dehydrogenase